MHTYSLEEITRRIEHQEFPFSGMTELGSASFQFLEPASYAGIALHAGARVREDVKEAMEVSEEDRYREEDPFTDHFLRDFPITIIARDSRFEYDLNRDEQTTIYSCSELTWGLKVWKRPLKEAERAYTLSKYREFHALMDIVAASLLKQSRYALIVDCHSYNDQREARMPWFESENPVINVGTGAVNRQVFGEVIEEYMTRMRELTIDGHPITVGENVVFKGGHLSRRMSQAHYNNLLVLAIEFRKIFMDEWSRDVYDEKFEALISHCSQVVKHITTHPLLRRVL